MNSVKFLNVSRLTGINNNQSIDCLYCHYHLVLVLIIINSESGLRTAVNKLQQLGIMMYFPLHDMVVVSPIWLSYILSSISKFNVEDGILMHNTLQNAWKVPLF